MARRAKIMEMMETTVTIIAVRMTVTVKMNNKKQRSVMKEKRLKMQWLDSSKWVQKRKQRNK